MPRLTLVSYPLCPYVQRAAIALAEKDMPFERVDVDLSNKPDWFTRISPLGKVPLLKVEEDGAEPAILFESSVIVEYLEETGPLPLHPATPLERAGHRAWIEFGSAVLAGIAQFYSARDASAFDAARDRLAARFDRLESALGEGPWFDGQTFGLVDAAFAPVFRYFDTFDEIADFGILKDGTGCARWREALAARSSVRKAVGADYGERLTAFLAARQSVLSDHMRAG